MTKRVCHIVPAVPPEFNGLGDYARQLWRHWPEPRPEWHVAALRVPAGAAEAWPGVAFHPFRPTAEGLLEALLESRADAVALHYVGHGYHPKGVPLWLPKALARWKSTTGGRLVTFFHELWATAPPWKLTFWLKGSAVALVRQLCQLSDGAMTSCFDYETALRTFREGNGPVVRIPVGANIEPMQASPPKPWPQTDESRGCETVRIVVFGTGGMRRLILRDHKTLLTRWVQEGRSLTVVLAGRSDSLEGHEQTLRLLSDVGATQIEERYDLSEGEASRTIASGDLALIHNRWGILHKSGSYAACCQHGLPVLIPACQTPDRSPVFVAQKGGGILPAQESERREEQARTGWESIVARWGSQL